MTDTLQTLDALRDLFGYTPTFAEIAKRLVSEVQRVRDLEGHLAAFYDGDLDTAETEARRILRKQ